MLPAPGRAESTRGKQSGEFLIVAEHPVPARCALAAAGTAGAHSIRLPASGRVLAAALRDRARAAADQPPHAPGALRTVLDCGVGHLLPPLKTVSTGVTEIVVSWHRKLLAVVRRRSHYTKLFVVRPMPRRAIALPGRNQKILTRSPVLTPKEDIRPKLNCGQIWYSKSAARQRIRFVRR